MNIDRLTLGVLLILSSTWGGSYLTSLIYKTWLLFPVIFTSAMIFIVGLIICITKEIKW